MNDAVIDIVGGEETEIPRVTDEQLLFEVLADPKCRALVAAADEPATAAELGECCSMATSTLYRKLDALERAGLLQVTARTRTGGNHAQTYARSVEAIEISLGGGTEPLVELSLE